MGNDNFIIIYNRLLDQNIKNKCEQIYLYAMLRARYLIFCGYTETTIDLLAQGKILSNSILKRKVVKIKSLLEQLSEQGIIQLEYEGELSAHTPLTIRFPDFGGHEQVTPDIFAKASKPAEFVVLVTVNRFAKEPFNGFEKAKEKWGDYLGCSKNTGIDIINKMKEAGKIYCVEGEKYRDENGRFGQCTPKWYPCLNNQLLLAAGQSNNQILTIVREVEKQETSAFTTNDLVKQTEQPKENTSDAAQSEIIEWGNWIKPLNIFIDKSDIELYVKQIHILEFKSVADKKLASIPEKVRYYIQKQINELVSVKQRENNKNAIIIDGKEISVNASNIEDIRPYLIDNFNTGYGAGVEVIYYSRTDKKKQRILLKRMAVSNTWECSLTDEIVKNTVDIYIGIIKKNEELDTNNFIESRKYIQDKFRIA
ncbi:hypothetical protein [Paenibacillus cymbidii]|uniref:hypothetical protein n=1 Tax=Paenibacillus cymbidii TaxID=1639034 RepID=UPI0010818F51|nr:hypothetical protein [Paenibacillus cymbidii]